jgi:hypothetical protein
VNGKAVTKTKDAIYDFRSSPIAPTLVNLNRFEGSIEQKENTSEKKGEN